MGAHPQQRSPTLPRFSSFHRAVCGARLCTVAHDLQAWRAANSAEAKIVRAWAGVPRCCKRGLATEPKNRRRRRRPGCDSPNRDLHLRLRGSNRLSRCRRAGRPGVPGLFLQDSSAALSWLCRAVNRRPLTKCKPAVLSASRAGLMLRRTK